MKKTNNEFIDEVTEIVAPMLAKHGFKLKKRGHFEKQTPNNNVFTYSIGCYKKYGEFRLRLSFGVKNKPLMKKINKIFEKIFLEEEGFSSAEDENMPLDTKKRLKLITRSEYIYGSCYSDWRDHRREGESLSDFWDRFRLISDGVQYSIKELDNWYEQFQESVDIVTKYASTNGDKEWIINNTGFAALYLLKEAGDEEALQAGIEKAKEFIILKHKIEPFLRHLDNVDFSDDK